MADLLKSNEIDAGGGYITDRGNWVSGFSETVDGITFTGYALNDIVHTSKAVYLSLVDNNTTNPDTDTTGSWRKFVDKDAVMAFVKSNQPYVGSDGYWYVYNPSSGKVEKTETLARGGEYLIDMTDDDCDFVMTAGTGDPADIFEDDDCNLNIKA